MRDERWACCNFCIQSELFVLLTIPDINLPRFIAGVVSQTQLRQSTVD